MLDQRNPTPIRSAADAPAPTFATAPPDARRRSRRVVLTAAIATSALALVGTIVAVRDGDGPSPTTGTRTEAELQAITEELVSRGLIPPESLMPTEPTTGG